MSHNFVGWEFEISNYNLLFLVFILEVAQIAIASTSAGNRVALLIELHAEIEAHTVEYVLDLIQRLFTEIFRRKHFALRALDQIAYRTNIGVLQTIIRAYGKL